MTEPLALLTPSLTPALHLTDDVWADVVRRHIRTRAQTGEPFQAYDLALDGCPEPDDSHSWGSALTAAAHDGIIRCVGAEPSRRPTVRGSLTRVWQGAT